MVARGRRSGAALLMAVAAVIGGAESAGPAVAVTYTSPGTVTEFSTGITAASAPVEIAAGPGGNLWFIQRATNQVGRITPNGKVTEFGAGITAHSFLQGIAAGPDGDLWFTQQDSDQIGRITPHGKVTEYSAGITTTSGLMGITAGPDGNLWFTQTASDQIGRITPHGKVTEYSAGITAASEPDGIAAGPDGNLWFTQTASDQIGRITPRGKVTEYSAGITAASGVSEIAAGPDGNMWFTEFNGNRVGRITTGVSSAVGTITEFSTGITSNSNPRGIAAGPDGNLWFTEFNDGQVARITPKGKVKEFSTGIAAASRPAGIAAGPDGNMWFTEFVDSSVARITTGVPSAPRTVSASPRAKAAVVSWAPPTAPGAAAITGYRVTATPGGQQCVSTGTLHCTVRGLKNRSHYRFVVTGQNAIGTGPPSITSPAVIVGTSTAPRTLKVTFPHPGSATLSWRAPAFHGSAPISSYQIRWSPNNGHTWTGWASTGLRRHASRTGLFKGQTYLVEVRARNNSGAGPIATLGFTQHH